MKIIIVIIVIIISFFLVKLFKENIKHSNKYKTICISYLYIVFKFLVKVHLIL